MRDVVVVGAGIFGQVIAAHLRRRGMDVLLLGHERYSAASPAAACVLRPSWMTNMTIIEIDRALILLDETYGLREVEFTLEPLGRRLLCQRVEPGLILSGVVRSAVVSSVEEFESSVGICYGHGELESAHYCVVATGMWAGELCPWVSAVGKWGWAHRSPPVARARIRPWAPYRQTVSLNLDDGGWTGDGYALKFESTTARAERSLERCAALAGYEPGEMRTIIGGRPYAETRGRPCLLSWQGRVCAVTGGAKNGTAAAAWAAREIGRKLC